MTRPTSSPGVETPGAPQDVPEGILHRRTARDVLSVVAIALGLIACSAGSLGIFLLLDVWASRCGELDGLGILAQFELYG